LPNNCLFADTYGAFELLVGILPEEIEVPDLPSGSFEVPGERCPHESVSKLPVLARARP
jgi:hypothetical protein